MNQLTYILAILVRYDVVSVQEALQLQEESKKGTLSSNLSEMISKVDGALETPVDEIEKLDARKVL